jgi:hypothetical protein
MVEEVAGLRRKQAVVVVPWDLVHSVFYSTYFLVPKKDGGIRPILYLKRFNANHQHNHFHIQSVLAALHPAYLHVPIWYINNS